MRQCSSVSSTNSRHRCRTRTVMRDAWSRGTSRAVLTHRHRGQRAGRAPSSIRCLTSASATRACGSSSSRMIGVVAIPSSRVPSVVPVHNRSVAALRPPADDDDGVQGVPACRREYEDPDDRRFHAQKIACAECGPRVGLRGPDGAVVSEHDAIGRTADVLRAGGVVAVKGIGGYHLACDARNGQRSRSCGGGSGGRRSPSRSWWPMSSKRGRSAMSRTPRRGCSLRRPARSFSLPARGHRHRRGGRAGLP